jgi:hypothetical protein
MNLFEKTIYPQGKPIFGSMRPPAALNGTLLRKEAAMKLLYAGIDLAMRIDYDIG